MIGGRLVSLVVDRWHHLPDLQYRTLICMAATALDVPKTGKPAETYWGGHERIARSWRQPYPDGNTDKDCQRRANVLRDVRRACRALVDAKAIEIVETDQTVRIGHAQVYRLTLRAGDHIPPSADREEGM